MTCAWQELLSLLPSWLRQEVDRQYKESLQEIRLRQGCPPQLIYGGKRTSLGRNVTLEDLKLAVNMACRYSPWTANGIASGYITAPGGHRLGLCGDAVILDERMQGIRNIRSLNIRVARDFPGIANGLTGILGNILILGKPGCGKTTLLRDLIRQLSRKETVGVVDTRGELFPTGTAFDAGQADVLTGCPMGQGLDAMIRTMSPDTVATDEITAEEDCRALKQAAFCGVRLLATAHAGSRLDFLHRPVYRPLVQLGLFDHLVIMQPDKSYRLERMAVCT